MKKLILLAVISSAGLCQLNAQVTDKKSKVEPANKPGITAVPKAEPQENKCCSSTGDMQVKHKLTRWVAPEDNILPIAFGNIGADPTADGSIWMSPLGNSHVEKISTGRYKLTIGNARISARASIIVTPQSTTPKICTVKFISASVFEVYVFTLNGTPVDGGFGFMVTDPLNLFN